MRLDILNKKNSNFIIHFIGIGGIGMSGIAELMLDQGYIIQGSDLVFNTTIKRLKDIGNVSTGIPALGQIARKFSGK